MLTIVIPAAEGWDEENEVFVDLEGFTLDLEHSLVSLSKWEAIHEKPFLDRKPKSIEEIVSYIECMHRGDLLPKDFGNSLRQQDFDEVNELLNRKMSATWFSETAKRPPNREIVTAELLYFYIGAYNLDISVQHWHLNRLFTLLRVASLKSEPPKKMSANDQARQMRELNAQRLAQSGSRG